MNPAIGFTIINGGTDLNRAGAAYISHHTDFGWQAPMKAW
jgi:hypothetical protein